MAHCYDGCSGKLTKLKAFSSENVALIEIVRTQCCWNIVRIWGGYVYKSAIPHQRSHKDRARMNAWLGYLCNDDKPRFSEVSALLLCFFWSTDSAVGQSFCISPPCIWCLWRYPIHMNSHFCFSRWILLLPKCITPNCRDKTKMEFAAQRVQTFPNNNSYLECFGRAA